MKIDTNEDQEVICRFLKESFPNKSPKLQATSKPKVYHCVNKGYDSQKMNALLMESMTIPKPTLEREEEMIKELFSSTSTVFEGRNYITIDKERPRAIKRLQSLNPRRDWNLFEIDQYEGYYIVWD